MVSNFEYRCIYTNVRNELKKAFFLREEIVIPFNDCSKLKQYYSK